MGGLPIFYRSVVACLEPGVTVAFFDGSEVLPNQDRLVRGVPKATDWLHRLIFRSNHSESSDMHLSRRNLQMNIRTKRRRQMID